MKYIVEYKKNGKWVATRNRLGVRSVYESRAADAKVSELTHRHFTARAIALHVAKPTLRSRAFVVAGTLVGVMEHGSNNHGAMVEKIIHANGGVSGEPWCGDFVAYAYKLAGSKVVERRWASTLQLGFLAGMKILAVRAGKAGDIVVFDFPGGASSDHTGLLVHYCNADAKIMPASIATHVATIEGNTGEHGAVSDSTTGGDGVYRKIRPIDQVARCVRVLR